MTMIGWKVPITRRRSTGIGWHASDDDGLLIHGRFHKFWADWGTVARRTNTSAGGGPLYIDWMWTTAVPGWQAGQVACLLWSGSGPSALVLRRHSGREA